MTLISPHWYEFGLVMRQEYRTFQRRKRSSEKCKPAYQTTAADQGETSTVLTFLNGNVKSTNRCTACRLQDH